MQSINLTEHAWQPFAAYGFTSSLFSFNYETLLNTWFVLALILAIALPIRWLLKRDSTNIPRFLVISFIENFIHLTTEMLGSFSFGHFTFITSLFTFILLANSISIIPWTEEPTRDINTTLALGLISFAYIHFFNIKSNGIKHYLKEYFQPFFLMFPLHVIGELAKIVSISFRLFGNIFGGSIISTIYINSIKGSWLFELIGIFSGANLIITIFFGIFEGALQAFVFSMLTLTYLSIATAPAETEHAGELS